MFAQNAGGVVVSDQVLHYLLQQLGSHMPFPGRQLGSSGVGQVILFKEPLLNGVRGSVPVTSLVRLGWFEWCLPPLPIPQLSGEQKALGVSCKPALLALATIWMLRIESPPNSKKLSWMPTCSTRRTSAQISAPSRPGCSEPQNLTTRI